MDIAARSLGDPGGNGRMAWSHFILSVDNSMQTSEELHSGRTTNVTGIRRLNITKLATRALHSVLAMMMIVSALPGSSCCEAGEPCRCCSSFDGSDSASETRSCCAGVSDDQTQQDRSCCSSVRLRGVTTTGHQNCGCEQPQQTTIPAFPDNGEERRTQAPSDVAAPPANIVAYLSRVQIPTDFLRARCPLTALERCVRLSRLTR